MDEDDYLIHYGVLGMKWGIRRQQKKAARYTKRAVKMDKKIGAEEANISSNRANLQSENVKRLKSKARVSSAKNDIRQLGNKIKNEKYGVFFRKRKEKKAKKLLEEAKKEYKKALDEDLKIETNQDTIRLNIQNGKELVEKFSNKRSYYLSKADAAKQKQLLKELDLNVYLEKKK